MMPEVNRERSGSELVFCLLKTLMVGYRMWGMDSALSLGELAGCLRTTDTRVATLAVQLANEGLVVLDQGAGTVRLSENGARDLLCRARPCAAGPAGQ
jgi:hypothetical protein